MLAAVLLCALSPLQLDGVFAGQAGCTMTQFSAGLAAGADLLILVGLDPTLNCCHQALDRQVTHTGSSYATQDHHQGSVLGKFTYKNVAIKNIG